MQRIVFLDRGTMGHDISLDRPSFEHEWVSYEATSSDQIVERLAGAHIAITNKVPLRKDTLAKLPDLAMIAIAATGYDVVDLDACRRRGIVVSNVRGYAVRSVPEHVFALIFALRRGLLAYRADVQVGEWERSGQFCFYAEPINDVFGSTLGIVGSGALGQAVARMGEALGMTCLFAGRKGDSHVSEGYTPFEEVLERSDVLTLHCPLTPSTRDLVAEREFALMNRRAALINCARGGVVNEQDLEVALETGQVAAAGIDCTVGEPPAPNSPIHRLKHRRDVIVTPHVGWASQSARTTLWQELLRALDGYVTGSPINALTY